MPKYQINYNRVAPDHRVPFDYTFTKKTQNPFVYLKHLKNGFNSSWVKFYHMHLTSIWLGLGIALAFYTFRNGGKDEILRDKVNKMPALHFLRQKENGNFAAWDNVLRKFNTDPFGNKDLPFQEY